MDNNNVAIAKAYYTAMAHKNLAGMAPYLHPNVQVITPLATIVGKEAVLRSAEKFFAFFESLTIRATLGSDNQTMLVINFDCPAPVGILRTAVLMTLQDGLIMSNELFHDTQFAK